MPSNNKRERPKCRQVIIALGLTPWPSIAKWDKIRALENSTITFMTGRPRIVHLSTGMRIQMRRMIEEGVWIVGEGGKPVRSPDSYTLQNQVRIAPYV